MQKLQSQVWMGVVVVALGVTSARADVVAVVSAKSQVMMLTKNEVLDIFLGRRARFPDGSSALPVDQTEGSAPREQFYGKLAAMSAAQLKAYWAKVIFTGRGQPPQTVSDDASAKALLAGNPNAIVYIDSTHVDANVRVVFTP